MGNEATQAVKGQIIEKMGGRHGDITAGWRDSGRNLVAHLREKDDENSILNCYKHWIVEGHGNLLVAFGLGQGCVVMIGVIMKIRSLYQSQSH